MHYHFSGICGTAMASLAVLMKNRGHQVTGSDENVYPPMSDLLKENHIEIVQGYSEDNLKPAPDFVVLGNALSRGNAEVEYALQAHLHYLSMAELLKNEFIRGNRSVVISGTHGKTTTTSLAAHVLTDCGKPTGFMVGGVPENFGVSSKDVAKGGYFVTEGDEYDTSFFDKRSKFFHYLPDLLILNNLEFDHADIFTNLDEIKKSFTLMLRQMPNSGRIFVNGDDTHALEVARNGFCPVTTFGFDKSNDAVIQKAEPLTGELGMGFDLVYQDKSYRLRIPLLGRFNVRNAVAVTLLALEEGIEFEKIQKALLSFKNVKRRLQKLSGDHPMMVFDDFAHHPTAIFETVQAVRQAWPDKTIHAFYQARSNTSIRRFHQEKMAQAFSQADRITFSAIQPRKSIPQDELLDLDKVVTELEATGKKAWVLQTAEEIKQQALEMNRDQEILLFMSQGDFYGLPKKVAESLKSR